PSLFLCVPSTSPHFFPYMHILVLYIYIILSARRQFSAPADIASSNSRRIPPRPALCRETCGSCTRRKRPAAPPVLFIVRLVNPALTGWANFWRASGAWGKGGNGLGGGGGFGLLFSGGEAGAGNSLPWVSISLLYTDYYLNDMAGIGGFRLAGSVTVIDVLQHLGLPY